MGPTPKQIIASPSLALHHINIAKSSRSFPPPLCRVTKTSLHASALIRRFVATRASLIADSLSQSSLAREGEHCQHFIAKSKAA